MPSRPGLNRNFAYFRKLCIFAIGKTPNIMEAKTKKSTVRKSTPKTARPRRRRVNPVIPGAKIIELVPDPFGTGR